MSEHSDSWPIDMNILAETAGRNATRMLPQLIPIFVEDADLLLTRMADALQTGDAGQLQQAAHHLKGNSASLGTVTITDISSELERLGKCGDLATAVATFATLSEEYNQVKAALLAFLNQTE